MLAHLGQPRAPLAAIEHGDAACGLEFLDPLGDRRLRGVQLGCRAFERPELDYPVKRLDLFQRDHGPLRRCRQSFISRI
jgi:hypothetical protein